MFKATSKGSRGWKAIISAMSTICEETSLNITSEGISFKGMAITKVAFIDFLWKAENFVEYNVKSDIRLGVRLEEFGKILKRADKDEDVTIEAKEGSMTIKFGNKTYDMALIRVDEEGRDKPTFEVSAVFNIQANELQRVIGDLEIMNDFIFIKAETGKVTMSTKGDSGKATAVIEKPELKVDSPQETRYMIEYISPIVSAVKEVVDGLVLGFSQNRPIKLSLSVSEMGVIDYYLAPALD